MTERYIYIPRTDGNVGVIEKSISFQWFGGFAVSQKQKCIQSLHDNAKRAGVFPLLEISSKSPEKEGVDLSAFNLSFETNKGHKLTVETAFQGSKVFENGGPYTDLYIKTSREAKKDERLKSSGKLIKFKFYNEEFELIPRTFFYDWLYINTLRKNKKLCEKVLEYKAFTDIEFNPEKSVNCQAYSVALFVSLFKNGVLEEAVKNKEIFKKILKSEYERKYRELSYRLDTFL